LLVRDKPMIPVMEWIRTYLMSRFATLREKIFKCPGNGRVVPTP